MACPVAAAGTLILCVTIAPLPSEIIDGLQERWKAAAKGVGDAIGITDPYVWNV